MSASPRGEPLFLFIVAAMLADIARCDTTTLEMAFPGRCAVRRESGVVRC
jgi:hypothetical protein